MNKKNKKEFAPLECGGNRPVTWFYQLDTIKGQKSTNSVTILSKPILVVDESGENGNEKFATVTLTRAEVAEILMLLEDDIQKMKKYCPDEEFI